MKVTQSCHTKVNTSHPREIEPQLRKGGEKPREGEVMGAKGKDGEKGRNGVGVGPCLHQTMRKEDTLMYPEQSARRVPPTPVLPDCDP